ncbi:gene transfer agent family protein [Bradyrhizobium sp. CB1015]|uniref:gene transfer agent family protein n=1 Tax=Bradyrhizobium sp. CB1015 TaxID=2976822 RepID=UPI0021AAF636|nr:gene transfer agent family protein [Bradyrhizobium sp. CB1015]UWU89765.1 gene transfer agent family protein [Bradyrhizobium sp. CB1015]
MIDTTGREITWAGGTHTFDLGHPWVRRVMSYRGPAPAAALARFEASNYSPADVERLIELGLIGGGMPEREVETLLDAHVRGKPLGPNVMLASAVLSALFVGADNG